jgi:hypothetical protein
MKGKRGKRLDCKVEQAKVILEAQKILKRLARRLPWTKDKVTYKPPRWVQHAAKLRWHSRWDQPRMFKADREPLDLALPAQDNLPIWVMTVDLSLPRVPLLRVLKCEDFPQANLSEFRPMFRKRRACLTVG